MSENNNLNGVDLSGALGDNHPVTVKTTQGVSFEEGNHTRPIYCAKISRIAERVIKYSNGVVKNEEQANYVLIGIVVFCFILSFIFFRGAVSGPSIPPTGFHGNIPNTPEYQNPPRPEDFKK